MLEQELEHMLELELAHMLARVLVRKLAQVLDRWELRVLVDRKWGHRGRVGHRDRVGRRDRVAHRDRHVHRGHARPHLGNVVVDMRGNGHKGQDGHELGGGLHEDVDELHDRLISLEVRDLRKNQREQPQLFEIQNRQWSKEHNVFGNLRPMVEQPMPKWPGRKRPGVP